jgi:serine/threonine protein kinase
MKLWLLRDIADHLRRIHSMNFAHCDLHGGNVILHDRNPDGTTRNLGSPFIYDVGFSRSTVSASTSNIQGVLPFVAPEVFITRQFTKASDIYAFGIIMYLVATGEPPFRDRPFDQSLVYAILSGLVRPTMPDSAPDGYKKLAKWCCDIDPNKRSEDGGRIWIIIDTLIDGVWNNVYHNYITPLSREEERKYSSEPLPDINELYADTGMKVIGLYIWYI